MSEGSNHTREISLGDDFGPVVVKVNGASIEVGADGRVEASASSEGKLQIDPAHWPIYGHQIGDEMEDGTVYAGISPDTTRPIYTTPADAPLTYTFNKVFHEVQKYADALNKQRADGHDDWRVPSQGELNVLFENRNKGKLAGTFNETGEDPAGWYWSSMPGTFILGLAQRFSDGCQYSGCNYRDGDATLRCVRG